MTKDYRTTEPFSYPDTIAKLDELVSKKNIADAKADIIEAHDFEHHLVSFSAIPAGIYYGKNRGRHYGVLRSPELDPKHYDLVQIIIVGGDSQMARELTMLENFKESTEFRGIMYHYESEPEVAQFEPYYIGSPGHTFFKPNDKNLTHLAKKFHLISDYQGNDLDLRSEIEFEDAEREIREY